MVKSNDRFDETETVQDEADATRPHDTVTIEPPRRRRRITVRRLTEHPQFYLTAPSPCPYLPDRFERKVFTHLVGDRAEPLNDLLTQGGFRRSQNIAYRPACDGCRACVSVRVVVKDFVWTKSLKRIMRLNKGLERRERAALPSSEQYSVFRAYLDWRHAEGGMADMTVLDYAMMVEDSHVDTRLFEYREHDPSGGRGTLIGCALSDVLADGLSMVYSFFEPDAAAQSLGTFMILDHVERAAAMGLPYVYLGYWVNGSEKMDYKTRFQPQEHLTASGWVLT
ncbi:MAG: arginyltransferase [Pseudomonadota bacterium]